MKPYEYLEHTADMGLVVRGKCLSELAEVLTAEIGVTNSFYRYDSVRLGNRPYESWGSKIDEKTEN